MKINKFFDFDLLKDQLIDAYPTVQWDHAAQKTEQPFNEVLIYTRTENKEAESVCYVRFMCKIKDMSLTIDARPDLDFKIYPEFNAASRRKTDRLLFEKYETNYLHCVKFTVDAEGNCKYRVMLGKKSDIRKIDAERLYLTLVGESIE